MCIFVLHFAAYFIVLMKVLAILYIILLTAKICAIFCCERAYKSVSSFQSSFYLFVYFWCYELLIESHKWT